MDLLGKIQRVYDLRTIWPHEARDFSKWLALDDISRCCVMSWVQVTTRRGLKRNHRWVDFMWTYLLQKKETGRKIVIEKQLEDTNHDHLVNYYICFGKEC